MKVPEWSSMEKSEHSPCSLEQRNHEEPDDKRCHVLFSFFGQHRSSQRREPATFTQIAGSIQKPIKIFSVVSETGLAPVGVDEIGALLAGFLNTAVQRLDLSTECGADHGRVQVDVLRSAHLLADC